MKKLNLLALVLAMSISAAFAQSYNPFTQNIHFNPEPSLNTPPGFECNTIQSVEFIAGLTTQDNAANWQTDPMKLIICLSGFTFNGPASTAISGIYAQNFNWAYDPTNTNCVIGTQNQVIHGTGTDIFNLDPLSSGLIKASLKVNETAPIGLKLSVDVTMELPSYFANNSPGDDNESTTTDTYCPLKIKGNVYFDSTLFDNNVNGTPISHPDNTPVYASLVDANGKVVNSAPILPNGTYEFLNVTPLSVYTVELSTTPGVPGQLAPQALLPNTWVYVNEDCCDRAGTDGSANGNIVVPVDLSTVLEVNFGIFTQTPLPITLNYFNVTENNCSALLSWATSKEVNTDKVEIYRKDAKASAYRKVATVKLAGSSNNATVYNYIDADVAKDESYTYQLNFIDIDGKSSQSNEASLTINCGKGNVSVNSFPNPATSDITIAYVTDVLESTFVFDIVDAVGRTVISESKNIKSGSNVMTTNVSGLAAGSYFINYSDVDGSVKGSIKFIKQ
jgi:Fe-S cluster assembly iron-binding protein IscA